MSIVGGLASSIKRAAAIKATALQIFTRNQRQWKASPLATEEVKAFRHALARSPIRFLCTHASYLCNLASPDPGLREKSMSVMIDELQRAEQIGAACVVLHPGSVVQGSRQDGLDRVADSLRRVLQETDALRVGIALENTAGQGTCLGAVVEDLAEIMQELEFHPRLGLGLDTAHAFAAGIDLRSEETVMQWMRSFEQARLIDRIWLLHLNDSQGKCGSLRDRHMHIGKGEIGLSGFRNILSQARLKQVPGIIETPKEGNFTEAETWDRRNLQCLRKIERAGK